jgi:uroporphyrinogen-III decarboxylase
MANEELFNLRLKRVEDAVALKEPDQLPMIPDSSSGAPYYIYNDGSHKATYYSPEDCVAPSIRYHEEFKPDVAQPPLMQSGKANEIAQSNMIDWPGRPGTIVSDMSTYQVIERCYMSVEEYDELLVDPTGFIWRKYIPRAYPGLKGFEGMYFDPSNVLGIYPFLGVLNPAVLEALDRIRAIAEANKKQDAVGAEINQKLTDLGFPPLFTGYAQAPFDIISDFFRGTAGVFEDQIECPEKIAAACEVFANMQIANLQYFRVVPMPVKRVLFPLHKGMDGFMSPKQFAELYWKPMDKIFAALLDMGVTPIIYTEGYYNTRYEFVAEQLKKYPVGSFIVHFERGDFAQFKKTFSGIAAISGGMPLGLLDQGNKEDVVNRMKYLIDTCAPGGGYLLDTSGTMEGVKYENLKAMFETARSYGKK